MIKLKWAKKTLLFEGGKKMGNNNYYESQDSELDKYRQFEREKSRKTKVQTNIFLF